VDEEGDIGEGASAFSGAAGEKGFGSGLSNDNEVCNRNGYVLKTEGASERSWDATGRSCELEVK
jgi:hypothetical protein